MSTFLIAYDPISPPVLSVLRWQPNGTVLAEPVPKASTYEQEAQRLYDEHYRFSPVWQDGWTWEQFCAEKKRLDELKAELYLKI